MPFAVAVKRRRANLRIEVCPLPQLSRARHIGEVLQSLNTLWANAVYDSHVIPMEFIPLVLVVDDSARQPAVGAR